MVTYIASVNGMDGVHTSNSIPSRNSVPRSLHEVEVGIECFSSLFVLKNYRRGWCSFTFHFSEMNMALDQDSSLYHVSIEGWIR